MCPNDLYQQLATTTGEDIATLARIGFSPLTTHPYEIEERDEPLIFDWDS